jgi:hypothetical protein
METRMVYIPRAVYPKYAELPWDELVAAAERGDEGVRFREGEDGYALMRGAAPHESSLQGKSLLWFQGWFNG